MPDTEKLFTPVFPDQGLLLPKPDLSNYLKAGRGFVDWLSAKKATKDTNPQVLINSYTANG